MNITQKTQEIPFSLGKCNILKLENEIENAHQIVRFSIIDSNDNSITIDYSSIDDEEIDLKVDNVFKFSPRKFQSTNSFNAILCIPTGIGAEIGGDSGDACVAAKLLGGVVDCLITHPNVVNAADFNEMTSNTWYVEGSILNRFMMGNIGLQKSVGNKTLLIYDNKLNGKDIPDYIKNCSVNAASAARVTIGNTVHSLGIDNPPYYECFYDERGMAIGKVNEIDNLMKVIYKYKDRYDSFALHTVINTTDPDISRKYFDTNEIEVNPWGGLEAIITHTISRFMNIRTAHAPMLADGTFNYPYKIVDPTKASETLSKTELFCILKGLAYSPKIIETEFLNREGVLSNENISCLIIPDRCIGLPVLAALEQDIPVIVVNDSTNLMKNDLERLPWKPGKFFRANNYLEVVGIIECLKAGISPDNLERPMKVTNSYA